VEANLLKTAFQNAASIFPGERATGLDGFPAPAIDPVRQNINPSRLIGLKSSTE
jgi:hypothetical protein